jgi:poly(3-hydroxybutyrate) depolymerase
MNMKSHLKPSISLNGYLHSIVSLFLILATLLLFTPCNGIRAENSNNRVASQSPELNYTEGEITIAQVEFDGIKYVTGTSMGGAMTYTLSYYIPEKITAIAPVIMQMGTTLIEEFKNAKPMPVMIINGSQDPLVPEWGLSGDRFGVVPMVDNIHYWKNRNRISVTAQVSDLPDICDEITDKMPTPSKIRKYVWKGPDHNDMIWLHVINGGHWLPGYFDGKAIDPGTFELKMGTWNCDYDAAAAIYDFFMGDWMNTN